ncbi:MAG TPA: hypothetical protein VHV83_01050 [Armatimonadota bacterium]|nr:hypothetical protein [Armatimonadota bacterium]
MLAAGFLALFAVLLKPLRSIPAYEYEQLERAPAWMTVVIGGAIVLLSITALGKMSPAGAQVFVGWSRSEALLVIDGYALWASAIIGAVLAVSAWVPAARRSLVPRTIPHFLLVLGLAEFALLMVFSLHVGLLLLCWLMLLAGTIILWTVLYRPTWRWEQLEVSVVLGIAALLGTIGLVWLHALTRGSDMVNMWSVLLSTPPHAMNGAMLFISLAWLGPAIYLPWWLWEKSDEETMVWMPAALLITMAGTLTLVRLLFYIFPAGGGDFSQLPGVEHLFLIKRILNWLLSWGLLALAGGSMWLAYTAFRSKLSGRSLRPIIFVVSGLLLLGIAGGVLGVSDGPHGHRDGSIAGLLWVLLTWAGVITVWLSAKKLLLALPNERDERTVLTISLWGTLAALVAIPPMPGFRALVSLWSTWKHFNAPPLVVVMFLLLTAVSAGFQLPQWIAAKNGSTPRVGAGWGIIGPFMLVVLLFLLGVFAGPFSPVLRLIRLSLLQAY